ncbi:hypothetical protein M3O96_20840 [Aquiflexum sp. TKW24L]|nr:hypothetical protein [Aquiflexum sp. TKW24L]MCL6261560.1 hypothetical protein [Aquiflexum sp. TKW24L]
MKANEKNESKAKGTAKDQNETRSAAKDQKPQDSKKSAPSAPAAKKK